MWATKKMKNFDSKMGKICKYKFKYRWGDNKIQGIVREEHLDSKVGKSIQIQIQESTWIQMWKRVYKYRYKYSRVPWLKGGKECAADPNLRNGDWFNWLFKQGRNCYIASFFCSAKSPSASDKTPKFDQQKVGKITGMLVLPALLHLCNTLLCGSNPMSGERRADYYPESHSTYGRSVD